MKRLIAIWLISVIFTGVFVVWQKVSGPTYEIPVNETLGDISVDGELERTCSINNELPVVIRVADPDDPNPGIIGTVVWRRFPTDEPWRRKPMVYDQGMLSASLPRQPMAGKVEYTVHLTMGAESVALPETEAAVARFKGDVPLVLLLAHVAFMVLGMLFSTRSGLEALTGGPALGLLTRITFYLLVVGGLLLGPLVQKFAFDALWTGWPLGTDWTDNKLAVGALVWLIAAIRTRQATTENPVGRFWVILATVTILVIYLIPHSIHGSTYDYATGEHIQVRLDADPVRGEVIGPAGLARLVTINSG